jgi:hypothetical protein
LVTKEPSNFLKHSNQIHLSLHSGFLVTTFCFISFSHYTENDIGIEGAIQLADALKSNTTLTELNLRGNRPVSSSRSLNIGNMIENEGAIKLFEALKSNSTLTSFNISGLKICKHFILTARYR